MALKSYDVLKDLDLSKYITQRDGADYINWAYLNHLPNYCFRHFLHLLPII